MPDKEKLIELAERVEALDGPDREVDRAILVALGKAQWRGDFLYWMSEAGSTRELVYTNSAPAFTASLDTAITLVPEGCAGWEIYSYGGASLSMPGIIHRGRAATPVLALVAASLRALAGERP